MELEQGTLKLPANFELRHATFDINTLHAKPADEAMLIDVMTICSCDIARKHDKVKLVINRIDAQAVNGVALTSYTLTMRLPLTVRIDAEYLGAMQLVNIERVHPPLVYYDEGFLNISVEIDSSDNPCEIESKSVTHIRFKRLKAQRPRVVSEILDDSEQRGSNKRMRQGSSGK